MRGGTLIMVDDERMPLDAGRDSRCCSKVRFRTLGCYPLTGAIESDADTLPAIIQEMLLTTTSERQGRVIDHDSVGVDGEEEAGRDTSDGARLRSASPRDIEAAISDVARAQEACCGSSPAAASTTARAR